MLKSVSLTALKHEELDPLCQNHTGTGHTSCLRTCRVRVRVRVRVCTALPPLHRSEESEMEIEVFVFHVVDAGSFLPPAFLHLRSLGNDNKCGSF